MFTNFLVIGIRVSSTHTRRP